MTTTLTRNDEEIEVEVLYRYYKGCRGSRNSMGVPEEPDDDPEIEIQKVFGPDGEELKLTSEEEDKIEKACWEDLEGYEPDYDKDED